MFWVMLLFVVIGLFVFVRQLWPLPYLKHVTYQHFLEQKNNLKAIKVIDIRDANEFRNESTNDTINISLGRLQYVWHKHLYPEENVFILSNGKFFKPRKASRILRKQGFKFLYVIQTDCH